MPTRNVVLTDRQAKLIDSLVRKGRYQNASEVLREGLRLIETREAEDAAKLQALRAAADAGIAAIERGEYRAFDSMDDLVAHLDTVAQEAIEAARRR
jgi:antitoxin ParD1/3/4